MVWLLPWVFIAASAMSLILWVALSLLPVPYFGLGNYDTPLRTPWIDRVTSLHPESPAARAGLQPGDQVLEITAPGASSLDTVLYGSPEGTNPTGIEVVIERNGHRTTTTIVPEVPPFNVTIARYEPLAVAFVFWGIGLLIWGVQPSHGVARLFFLMCQLAAGVLAAGAISSIYLHLSVSPYMFRSLLVVLAPVAFHFYATFPSPLPDRPLRLLLKVVYGVAFAVLTFTIIVPVALSWHVAEPMPQSIQRAYAAVALLGALGLLFRRYAKPSAEVRYRRRLLIAGMLGSILPMLALSLAPEILTGATILDYVWTFPALVLLPLSVAVAVKQGELGRVDFLLNRGVVYTLLATLLIGLYTLLFWWVDQFDPQIWSRPLLAAALAVAAIIVYNPLRLSLQRLVDRIFYGGWYDYHKLVRLGGAELRSAHNVAQLTECLMDIMRTMRFEAAGLLWPREKELVPAGSFGFDTATLQKYNMPADGALARQLINSGRAFTLEREQLHTEVSRSGHELTQDERALLNDDGVRFFLPLVSKEVLYGIVLLGRRQGEAALSEEDYNILVPLTGQAAMAAENVALLEELRGRLAEMKHVRDELAETHRRLVESREAEQLRLARELHDGAVQQLLGISYQLATKTSSLDNSGDAPAPTESTQASDQNEASSGLLQVSNSVITTTPAARSATQASSIIPMKLRENNVDSTPSPETIRREVLAVVSQLRNMIGELRPPGLEEFGLVTALEGYIAKLQREGSWEGRGMPVIEVDFPSTELSLSEPVALALFRTAQEAIRNALKHARSRHINLQLKLSRGVVSLAIKDDGQGFQVPIRLTELVRNNHFGIIGMRERVEAVGGTLMVRSRPGSGTEVAASIPLSRRKKGQ